MRQRLKVLSSIAIIASVFFAAHHADAAGAILYVTPASAVLSPGGTVTVSIQLGTGGVSINAASGTLTYPANQLSVVGFSKSNSIFSLWPTEPTYSNAEGTFEFEGGLPTPGYSGSSGQVLSVTFRAKTSASGTAPVSFAVGSAFANDGSGTDLRPTLGRTTLTIREGPNATPGAEIVPVKSNTGEPVVISSTHPDVDRWYNQPTAVFSWTLPNGVDAVSFLIDPKPGANPGNQSDGLVSSMTARDMLDGTSYFHIKFHRDGAWGPITHFRFNTDTQPPASFAITRIDGSDLADPHPRLTFATSDLGSGTTHYLMRIGDSGWTTVTEAPSSDPFTMPLQAPGTHRVVVVATDDAGNTATANLTVFVSSITKPVITDWSRSTVVGGPGAFSGTADPDTEIRFSFDPTNANTEKLLVSAPRTRSTIEGTWNTVLGDMPDGVYTVRVYAVDTRGAISEQSPPVRIIVGSHPFFRMWLAIRSLFSSRFLSTVLELALLLAASLVIQKVWRYIQQRHPRKHTSATREERKLKDHLSLLSEDLDEELTLLKKVEKHRPLYPEEKYLRSKIAQYRKTVRFLLTDAHSRLAKKK